MLVEAVEDDADAEFEADEDECLLSEAADGDEVDGAETDAEDVSVFFAEEEVFLTDDEFVLFRMVSLILLAELEETTWDSVDSTSDLFASGVFSGVTDSEEGSTSEEAEAARLFESSSCIEEDKRASRVSFSSGCAEKDSDDQGTFSPLWSPFGTGPDAGDMEKKE